MMKKMKILINIIDLRRKKNRKKDKMKKQQKQRLKMFMSI
jgi:hypothetical protein